MLAGQSIALSVLFICGEEEQQAVFRPGLHPSVLSVCRVSPVEQFEDMTEEQKWSVLVQVLALTPIVLPFSSPGLSFKAAANQVQQVSLVFLISEIGIPHDCIQQL